MRTLRLFSIATLALVLCLLADAALGCPTCKDQLAHDPASANLARGYFYSILFMLSMPILILSGLLSYFYWEIRRARARTAEGYPHEAAEMPPQWLQA